MSCREREYLLHLTNTYFAHYKEKKELGCRQGSVNSSLPSILPPGFESQTHHQRFNQFVFELCRAEETKKRPGLAHFLKKSRNGTARSKDNNFAEYNMISSFDLHQTH